MPSLGGRKKRRVGISKKWRFLFAFPKLHNMLIPHHEVMSPLPIIQGLHSSTSPRWNLYIPKESSLQKGTRRQWIPWSVISLWERQHFQNSLHFANQKSSCPDFQIKHLLFWWTFGRLAIRTMVRRIVQVHHPFCVWLFWSGPRTSSFSMFWTKTSPQTTVTLWGGPHLNEMSGCGVEKSGKPPYVIATTISNRRTTPMKQTERPMWVFSLHFGNIAWHWNGQTCWPEKVHQERWNNFQGEMRTVFF